MEKYFDTHCHINRPEFDGDRAEVVARARENGVGMLTLATCVPSSRDTVCLAEKFDGVYAAVGIHPNDTGDAGESDMDELRRIAKSSEKVIAIGETGLDYFRDRAAPEIQRKFLQMHLELAKELNLPVALHARKSEEDMLDIVEPFLRDGGKAVWHCFVAGKKKLSRLLERVFDMGLMLGLGGLVTFEDQKPLRQAISTIPDRFLMLETDAPFLVPRPKASDRNEPIGVMRVAEELAALRGVTAEDIARITTRNAIDFLGLGGEQAELEKGKIAYAIRNSLYVALTNDCNNNCVFCARNNSYVVKGHDIRLDHDPETDEVLAAMGDVSGYDEVVFCGFGECTLRLEVLKAVAGEMKRRGQNVRLNTNGLANLQYARNIVPELKGIIDTISVSLNTADPKQYDDMCRSRFGVQAFDGMCDFVRACVAEGIDTVCTVVDMPDIDVESARRKTEELGAQFRVRSYVDVG